MPWITEYVIEKLKDKTNTVVTGVVGFPSGAITTEAKVFSAKELISMGCKELDKVKNARSWLEKHAKKVAYNDTNFTPEKLETQIRSYYALRKICEERGIDFLGIKAHGDLTDWHVTMDLAEAFLNDNYDCDG